MEDQEYEADRDESIFEAGRWAGMKEVVEWIQAHTHRMNTNMYGISLDGQDWQSKLKEWGVEDVVE